MWYSALISLTILLTEVNNVKGSIILGFTGISKGAAVGLLPYAHSIVQVVLLTSRSHCGVPGYGRTDQGTKRQVSEKNRPHQGIGERGVRLVQVTVQ